MRLLRKSRPGARPGRSSTSEFDLIRPQWRVCPSNTSDVLRSCSRVWRNTKLPSKCIKKRHKAEWTYSTKSPTWSKTAGNSNCPSTRTPLFPWRTKLRNRILTRKRRKRRLLPVVGPPLPTRMRLNCRQWLFPSSPRAVPRRAHPVHRGPNRNRVGRHRLHRLLYLLDHRVGPLDYHPPLPVVPDHLLFPLDRAVSGARRRGP